MEKDWQLISLFKNNRDSAIMLILYEEIKKQRVSHCVKSVQLWSFFWSVFSRIQTEYGEILRIYPYSVRMRENTDHKKFRIWTLFTQWLIIFHVYANIIRYTNADVGYENLPISFSSHKNHMLKVSHYSTVYFLRYTHPRYRKCLFTNIRKQ